MIIRQEYLNKLISLKDKELIKVVTGIRRCGKSTMFKIFQNYLLENGVDKSQIININFEDINYEHLTDYKNLYNEISQKLIPNKQNYIFLDEIQHVKNFEKTVDSLFIKDNTDIYNRLKCLFFIRRTFNAVIRKICRNLYVTAFF